MSEQRTQDGAVQRWGASAALFACAWAVGAESAANGPADGDRVLMGLALGLGLAMIAMAWRARGANAAANAVLVAATGAGAAAATTSGATCTGASLLKTLAPGAYMGAGVGLAAAGLAVARRRNLDGDQETRQESEGEGGARSDRAVDGGHRARRQRVGHAVRERRRGGGSHREHRAGDPRRRTHPRSGDSWCTSSGTRSPRGRAGYRSRRSRWGSVPR